MKEFKFLKEYPKGENGLWMFTEKGVLTVGIIEGTISHNIELKAKDIDEVIATLKEAKKKLNQYNSYCE